MKMKEVEPREKKKKEGVEEEGGGGEVEWNAGRQEDGARIEVSAQPSDTLNITLPWC